MADKPSRALVVYGDGLARSVNPSHTHLHSLASRACCGFLSLPHSPPSENEDARIIREFAELLDSSEAYNTMNEKDSSEAGSQKTFIGPTISERFAGMKSAIATNNSSLSAFCNHIGFTILQPECVVRDNPHALALELLKLLGFQDGTASETCQFDLVVLHVEEDGIEDVDGLLGELMKLAQPGTEVGSRLHLSVVLSFGNVSNDDHSRFSIADNRHESNSELRMLYPRQSYTTKGGKPRENVRHHCPMLVAQWQDGVTRKDEVGAFSFQDFKEDGGNLVIPADRFLHELTFKLWKAPKYGA
ncbi:unnamed protein product [Cuscuta campestris]|uniref:Uncharacterized protein n=1 Tax=Cuscuta campestris TaxID=132261 RepID=A0A484K8D8_9ASTE|nr:unnamed protein product [Cuscuta campestris]